MNTVLCDEGADLLINDPFSILQSFSLDFPIIKTQNKIEKSVNVQKTVFDPVLPTTVESESVPKASINEGAPKSIEKPIPSNDRKTQLPIPFTVSWMVRRIRNDSLEESFTCLQVWMNRKQHAEIDENLIHDLQTLSDDKAIQAIQALEGPKRCIKGARNNELTLPVQISIPTSG